MIENLVMLGLTEKEARVYLMLVRIGPSPASTLARRVNMKRASVYAVLDALLARNLVSFEECSGCRRYLPHDPQGILYDLEQESAALRVKIDLAKECIIRIQEAINGDTLQERKTIFCRGTNSVLNGLIEWLDLNESLFVMFLGFGYGSLSANTLQQFLVENDGEEVIVGVSNTKLDHAKEIFSHLDCHGIENNPMISGELLLQEDKVLFLISREDEPHMMCINDSAYAKYVREVLMAPIFSTIFS